MAVIAQRQRRPQAPAKRLKTPEMSDPVVIAQGSEPDRLRPALVAEAQPRLRKIGRGDGVVECVAEGEDRLLRSEVHLAIWGTMGERRNHMGYTDGYWWSNDGLR